MDSFHRAQELASLIMQSTSPSDVASAVRSFLLNHPADQSRPFFSTVFPVLVCKIFGFDASLSQKPPFPLGWIDCFQDGDLSRDIFGLLSPSSFLLSSIFAADRRSLVKFVFPVERLPEWVKVVIANDRYRPFLPELCPLFASRIKEDSGQVQVLTILLSNGELLFLLKKLDTAYHSKLVGPSSAIDPLHKYVPLIREQLQDWEVGLSDRDDVERPSLHENATPTLKFFSDSEDGGKQLLQLLILRAETEAQSFDGEKRVRCRQALDSLKSLVVQLFGPGEKFRSSTPKPVDVTPTRDEVFTPKHPGVGKCTWDNVKYKGDWMKRPITESEVAWLARLLVRLSDWANDMLGFDHQGCIDSTCRDSAYSRRGWRYVDLNMDELRVGGPKDALKMFVCGVGSLMKRVCRTLQRIMREYDLRVNLRVLASKKVVLFFLIFGIIYVAKVALRLESSPSLSGTL